MARKRKADAAELDDSENEVDNGANATHDLESEKPPSKINPYAVLDIERDASPDQIKSAYRKLALKCHPDKVTASEKDAAHTKFQEIAFAYAILSEPQRRKRYDTTGRTSESFDDDDDFNWADFFRAQFEDVVDSNSIERFKKEYQGSEEEKMDVIAAYVDFEGDLDALYSTVMLSNPIEDDKRFRVWIDEEIDEGRVEAYDAYVSESAKSKKSRVEQARREGEEAKAYAKELGVYDKLFGNDKDVGHGKKAPKSGKSKKDDHSSLAALIQQRQKSRADNFLVDLEAKYAGKAHGKASGKKPKNEPHTTLNEPSEEAFAKNRAKPLKSEKTSGKPRRKVEDESDDDKPRQSKRARRQTS